jgi:hypothetical protein
MSEPSALVAKLLETVAKDGGSRALNAIFGGLSKFRDALRMNFSDYLDSAVYRASHVKTLLHRDEPANLLSIYVETFLKSGNKVFKDTKLIDDIRSSASVLVVGSAGAGKTMFIRYAFLQLIEGNFGVIPIFVELRGLNTPQYNDDLIQFIYELVIRPGAVVTRDQFNDCFRENMFILILDGLDEVEHDRRLTVERQIVQLREAYPKLGIVVTSRPDESLVAWSDFKMYHIQRMTKAQVTKLIRRLPYDPELRTQFINEVDTHLYERHRSFVSNPLLATMMLMTFDQFAHIPDKIHIFYEQAFETLFFRHDSGKQAAFHRKMYTDLAINDFKNCLSAICVSSYFKAKFQFSETEILNFIRVAAQSEKMEIIERDYLKDLLESVCILQRDGLFISFTHRSFQEYFAAFYVSRGPSTSICDLLDVFCLRIGDDNVIPIAFDMHKFLIEREWILPRIKDLTERIDSSKSTDNIVDLVNATNLNLFIYYNGKGKGMGIAITFNAGYCFIRTLQRLYRENLGNAFRFGDFDLKNNRAIVETELERRRLGFGRNQLELRSTDHEWVVQTTLGESLPKARDALLSLAAKVEASVSQQKRSMDDLFK